MPSFDTTGAMPVIGYTPKGRPVFLIAGGDGEGEGTAGQGDPAGAGTEPKTGTQGDPAAGQGGAPDPDAEALKDPKGALELIRKLRGQIRDGDATKQQLATVQSELKKLQDAQLSESEKLSKRAGELEAENAGLKLRIQRDEMQSAFGRAGQKAGARVPGDVWKLVDLAEVQFDADGSVKNADKLVGKLRERSPEHFLANAGNGSVDGGARVSADGATDMSSLIRRAAGRPV